VLRDWIVKVAKEAMNKGSVKYGEVPVEDATMRAVLEITRQLKRVKAFIYL